MPDLGRVVFDVAYGGNFYAIIEPQETYRGLDDISALDIQRLSPVIRRLINEKYDFVHPENPTITGLRHVLWAGKAHHPEAHARNAVFYGEKAIDRSPCGTGTSGRMAQLAARGELKVGDDFVHESIIGSLFRGRVEASGQGRRSRRDRPLGRGPGLDHRPQHHLPRRPRSLRERLQRAVSGDLDSGISVLRGSRSALAPSGRCPRAGSQHEERGLTPSAARGQPSLMENTHLLILRCFAQRSLEGRNSADPTHGNWR